MPQVLVWLDERPPDIAILDQPLGERHLARGSVASGGGCLYMLIALSVMVVFDLITIGVSVALTLAIR